MPSTGRNERPVVAVAAGCLVNSRGEVLICQRPPGKIAAGKWEFPGGKIESGESPRQALERELHEELGLRVREARPLIRVTHDYSDRCVVLNTWRIGRWDGEPQSKDGQAFRWVVPNRLEEWDLLAADQPIVTALRLPAQYVFTPPAIGEHELLEGLPRLPSACLLRLRLPSLDDVAYERLARRLLKSRPSLSLMLDRNPQQAVDLGAAGWHATSTALRALKQRPLPAALWFAASCHDPAEIALARGCNADFVVAGPLRTTPSHPQVSGVGWPAVQALAATLSRPLYAIGGVTPDDLEIAWMHGAQGVAGISAYWSGGVSGSGVAGSSAGTR